MIRGKNTSRSRGSRRKESLRLENLEAREMLASDLGLGATSYNNDPFSFGAFSAEEIVQRAETTPYQENELVVAFNFRSEAARGEAALDDDFWAEQLPGNVDAWTTVADYQRSNGSSIVIADLTLADGFDPADAVAQLKHPNIVWSSPNFLYDGKDDPREIIPNDPQYFDQYHHPLMQNDLAWDLVDFGDENVVIAVTDDGVSLNHLDLADNIWENTGEIPGDSIDNDLNGYADDVNGWSFIYANNDPNPSATGDHGTHVAGIAAGRTDNAVGIAGTAGNATIMPIQFYDGGEWPAVVIRDSFFYAADNDATIVTTSYNIDGWVGDPVFAAGVQYAHDAGVLYFNSAGNGSSVNPPRQVFEQPLLVASTTDADTVSDFSNTGTGIDLASPGSDILSTIPGNSYDYFSGTSMATPNAAGVAALIWSQNPTWSSFQVAAQLRGTLDNIDAINPAFVGLMGGGRVNSYRALTETIAPAAVIGTGGVPSNGAVTEDVNINEFSVRFSGVLDPATAMDSSNYTLTNAGTDGVFGTADDEVLAIEVASMYMVGSNEVDLSLVGGGTLEVGDYRLSVVSGGITDPFGTPIDGDLDGVAGGNYETDFSVINPFKAAGPNPGLIAKRTDTAATLSDASDSDVVKFFAEQGETITAIATPISSTAKLSLEVPGVAAAETAAAAGDTVVLTIASIDADGEYDFVVSADAGTTYSLDIYKNVDISGLIETPSEIDLSASEIQLGSSRYAALASADGVAPGISANQYSSPAAFVDISGTGTALGLGDDGEATISSSIGNSLMPSGQMTISNNGVLASGGGLDIAYSNAGIPSGGFDAALFPFWDDIDDGPGDVYWEERVIDGIDALVVQWDGRPHFSNIGDATFQIQLFDSGPVLARYAYQDVDFGDPSVNNGASASIGAQTSAADGIEYSVNQAIVFDGDVIEFVSGTPMTDVDEFTLELTGGETIDVVLDFDSPVEFIGMVELVDPAGSVVATATPGRSVELGIFDFVASTAGEYTVRVSSGLGGRYYLIVTEDLAYETEPNNTESDAIDITNHGGAFGFMGGGSVGFSQFSDPSAFVDISATGIGLGLSDDGEATVTTTVGNEAFPAGTITIGNNGMIASGADVGIDFSNGSVPNDDFDFALMPFWDDIDADSGNVYWEERQVDGVNALIVQWDGRPHFSDVGDSTFQLQVLESGLIRYVYEDVVFGSAEFDFGASATIGYQSSSSEGASFSQNSPVLSNGDVIEISTSESDIFRMDVASGDALTISTSTPFDNANNEPLNNNLDLALEVRDSFGTLLASDLNSAADGRNAVVDLSIDFTGEIFISVVKESGTGEYALSVDRPGDTVDGDFNDDGLYDCGDIDALTTTIAVGSNDISFDLTGDGLVDLGDRDAWLSEAGIANGIGAAYLLGDANLDGAVDVGQPVSAS
ncbi:MAG: S8 family serine peptidase [Planctomycetota bacterium]